MTFSAPASAGLSLRVSTFIEALCRCVAGEGARHRIAGPLVVLIWTRLRRLASRFAILAADPQHAPSPRHRTARKPSAPHTLPRGFGWLSRLLPGTAAIASQFRHLLDDPEMAEFIAANPASGRILRPLCQTLGIRPPPSLRLPPRPVRPPTPDPPEAAPRPAATLPSTFVLPPSLPNLPRAPGGERFFRRRPAIRP